MERVRIENTPIMGRAARDSQEAGTSLTASNFNFGRSSKHPPLPKLRKERCMRHQTVFLSISVAFAEVGTVISD